MNRQDFLRRALVLGGGLLLAPARTVDALAAPAPAPIIVHDSVIYPSGKSTIAMLDAMLREHYLPVIKEQLDAPFPARHHCGRRYVVRWLDCDGKILTWRSHADSFDAYLVASCPVCRDYGSFNYAHMRFGQGRSVYPGDSFLSAMTEELWTQTANFHDHLRGF